MKLGLLLLLLLPIVYSQSGVWYYGTTTTTTEEIIDESVSCSTEDTIIIILSLSITSIGVGLICHVYRDNNSMKQQLSEHYAHGRGFVDSPSRSLTFADKKSVKL
eukprot:UN22235